MEIQQLKYFVEVVRQQSFTKAAAQLFVTQPMLTRAIKSLEEELNIRLIERTSKSFCLTDAGRILYERRAGSMISGKITVTAPVPEPSAPACYLP